MQLIKLDLKMTFVDEYDKFLNHQTEALSIYQNQMLAERIQLKMDQEKPTKVGTVV